MLLITSCLCNEGVVGWCDGAILVSSFLTVSLVSILIIRNNTIWRSLHSWLVDFGFNGPLRQYFSLYRAVSQREGERKVK